MGFGTAIAPLLFILGYTPLQIIPTILISEVMTGVIDAYFDHEFGNAIFTIYPMSDSTKLSLFIGSIGSIAIFISVIFTFTLIHLSESFIKIYVAILVLFMGFVAIIKATRKEKGQVAIKKKLLIVFSLLAGFNKGIGGGGYGPVITLGQIHSGIYEKTATAIVSFAEAMVSIVGIIMYCIMDILENFTLNIDFILLPSIFTGGFLAAITTPYLVRIIPNKIWKYVIPTYATFIGVYLIIKIIFP